MKINISREISRFDEFLDDSQNIKIIFSGKYGIGKTYFIHKFFDAKMDKYVPIYIMPIHYSVASNEDIFELIKVDILASLIKIGAPFLTNDATMKVAISEMCKNKPKEFAKTIVDVLRPLNKGFEIIENIINFFDAIEDYKKEMGENEKEVVGTYLSLWNTKTGSIYENDQITRIIKVIMDRLHSGRSNKYVLVIDDLDRLDPEHIFRILNILSVHEDYKNENENKFGFDKTILVCDINNIHEIYKYKYGERIDFNGYIDKFFSREIYQFANTNEVIDVAESIILSMKTMPNDSYYKIRKDCYPTQVMIAILKSLIRNDRTNVRALLKIQGRTFRLRQSFIFGGKTHYTYYIPGIAILDIFRNIFSSQEDMRVAFTNLVLKDEDWEECCQLAHVYFVPVADMDANNLKIGTQNKYSFNDGKDWTYSLRKCNDDGMYLASDNDRDTLKYISMPHISQILSKTCEAYLSLTFLDR